MSENTKSSLEANFKYVQADTKVLLPDNSVLLKALPKIAPAERIGRKFLQPVQLAHENGFTYGDGTVFALNDSIAGVYEEAEVDANPIVLNTKISESAANRMANKDKFLGEGALRVLGMWEAFSRRAEISMLYGQSGLGISAAKANVDSTHTTVTFTAASWSPGIWSGAIGAQFYWYNGASLVSSGADAIFSCYAVNLENRTVTFAGTATGISDLETSIGTSNARTVFFYGSKTNDMLGLDKQIVGGTTYFGIDPTIYNLWQGNTHSAGNAQLTMQKCLKAAAKPVARGGLMSDLDQHVSAATYADLNADQAALRAYDGDYSPRKAENGTESLVYHGPNGKIRIVINNIVKEGESFQLPMQHIKRIGAKDIGFTKWDGKDEYFKMLESSAGYQLRMSCEFAVLLDMPARACKITDILNNS